VVVVEPAPVSITLTVECWRFVHEARSWPALIPLPVDIYELFGRTTRFELSGSIPEPRCVIQMTRPQAEVVQRWLHALHDDLKYDDARRLICLLCISRVAVGIMLSQR
jgi:hypothetical protein